MKTFVRTSVIVTTLVALLLVAAPAPRAEAGLPVFETNPAVIGGIAVTAANASTQTLIMNVLNGLAWTVAKTTIQSITRSTVNWINSGFNGSPAFVTDLQQNLNVLSDTVANNFFEQLNRTTVDATGFNLTSPFQDQITQQLRTNYYRATGSLLGLNQYDLSGHSSNPADFLNGNFSQGGFNAFFSANSNPANNPFGAYQVASDALWNQIDAASKQRVTEYTAGKGFLPWRGNCAHAPAQSAANTTTGAGAFAAEVTANSQPLAQTEPCYGSPVKTPGSVIESQLENQLGSGVRQLELADSINEIVGALMGQLVNQVLGSGGLSGVSQPSAGGGSSYLDQATNSSQYNAQTAGAASGVTQIISNDLGTLAAYRDNWQKILDAATVAQQSCGVNSVITPVITQATAGVARANTAIQQETAISKSIQAATASTAVNSSTQITTALAQYQSYLGAPTTPSASDEAYAAAQSTDTSGTTDGSTPSLYTQMVAARTSCPAQT